mmetsp:Transcript_45278/g.142444  ORF Transcript_45278/g.142444 Transcript_45278/m.142444 type:complete len:351 (+) Transcript_45278:211-1263(+)
MTQRRVWLRGFLAALLWARTQSRRSEDDAGFAERVAKALPRSRTLDSKPKLDRQEPWLARPPSRASDGAVCQMLDDQFPLTPSWDRWLPALVRGRGWRPQGRDGADPTRFYPTREQVKLDFYGEDRSPYDGLARFNETEAARWAHAYVSSGQASAQHLERTILKALGGPPRLTLEVGSFIGSAAVNVWGRMAKRKYGASDDGQRLVICADTWQGAVVMRMGSHPDVIKMKNGFIDIGTTFMRRVLTEGLAEEVFPLSFPSIATARLLYLLGYKIDVVYVDSAHELGETLVELSLFYALLRPGGLLMGDDLNFEAVHHDVALFAACKNLTVRTHGIQWHIKRGSSEPLERR